jgi:hypothetical protein
MQIITKLFDFFSYVKQFILLVTNFFAPVRYFEIKKKSFYVFFVMYNKKHFILKLGWYSDIKVHS